jgi:hypothetical protein
MSIYCGSGPLVTALYKLSYSILFPYVNEKLDASIVKQLALCLFHFHKECFKCRIGKM